MVPVFDWPTHDSVDNVVADDTLKLKGLFVMSALPDNSFSVIWNNAVIDAGAVTIKLNDDPPFKATRVDNPLPVGPYVGATKSAAIAEVGPAPVITVTVHEITSAIRMKDVELLVWPIHERSDKPVGVPRTANENVLPAIPPPEDSCSVITNELVMTAGAVSTKLKEAPPFATTSASEPAPLGPYVGTVKSDERPIANPAASFTVIVHEIASRIRTYVVAALVWPIQDRIDAVVADVTLNVNGLPLTIAAGVTS